MSSSIRYEIGLNQSIQEEDLGQESLKARQLQIIFETALDGMAIADDQGRYLDVNPAVCELFGIERDKLLGRYIWEFVEPGFDFQIIWQKLQQEEKLRLELRLVRLDGEIRIVEYVATNFLPDGHLLVMRDVTQSKQAEEKVKQLIGQLGEVQAQLKETEIALSDRKAAELEEEQFFNVALDLLCIADVSGHFRRLNRAWETILGYSVTELEGQLFLNFVHPDDLAPTLEVISELSEQKPVLQFTNRYRTQDGTYRYIEWRSIPCGNLIYAAARDITDRRQTENILRESEGIWRTLVDVTPAAVAMFDRQMRYLVANQAWNQQYGLENREIIGKSHYEIFPDIPQNWKDIHALCLTGVTQKNDADFWVRGDGRGEWVRWEIRPWIDRHGEIGGLLMYTEVITDRKQAEAKLQEISERLSFALKSGRMGCWEWDIIQNTLVWDDRMYELYGVTKESDARLAYDIWATGLHPDDREATEIIIRQAVLGEAEYNPEFRVVHPDGSIHFIKAFGLVQRDAQGNALKMIGVNFDISDRKQTEILLKQSQKRYQTLAEASPIGVFLTDAQGDCLYVNQSWSQITGLSQEKALGPNWSITLHPDDREQVFQEWYESTLNKKEFESEYRFLRPDSSVAWVIGQALALIDNQGEIEGYVGTITDITDRKRQEQALRLIVEGTAAKTGEAFFQTCVQYLAQVLEVRYAFIAEFVDSEKLLVRTLAFWAGDDFGDNFTYNLVGSPCEKVNAQNDLCIYSNSVQSLFPENNDLVTLQAESYAGVPIVDGNGNTLGLLAVLDNKPMAEEIAMQSAILRIFATRAGAEIERIEAEAVKRSEIKLRQKTEELETTLKQLQATQLQLIQAEKMSSLGQLVAGIAHEINNPVNFIYGNIQAATDYATDLVNLIQLYQEHYPSPLPAISDFTENIDFEYVASDFPKLLISVKNGATRIRDIVKSLRTFSRLDEADLKEIDIHENIESTLVILQNRLNGRAGNPEIHVQKNYGNLPLVECYGGLLNQVFMNLLVNAIDAIEQQQQSLKHPEKSDYQGQITISTFITSENQVFISIQDNGAGMSPQVQEKIFNPFFTTKPVGKGTGMGLAISYQIVTKNHQGNLQCFSTFGKGTEFRMELPICDRTKILSQIPDFAEVVGDLER